MRMREAWEAEAESWIRWARAEGHDSYWRFHRDQFFALAPPPGRRTLREPKTPAGANVTERWQRMPPFLHVRARRA
jgi:hypothetical protein